jgi:hypothetical protein
LNTTDQAHGSPGFHISMCVNVVILLVLLLLELHY